MSAAAKRPPAKERIAAKTAENIRAMLAFAMRAETPAEARRYVTISEFAAMVGWAPQRARQTLTRMSRESGAELLVNVGSARSPKYVVAIEDLERLRGVKLRKKQDDAETRLEALETRLARIEAAIAKLAPTPTPGEWLTPSQAGQLLGVPSRTIGRLLTELGLRSDPAMVQRIADKRDCLKASTKISRAAFGRIADHLATDG